MAAGSKWTDNETVALIDAYGEKVIQEAVDGMATNKVLYCELQRIMKEQSNIDRTPSQIETKMKKLRSGYTKLKDRIKQSGNERPYLSSALTSTEKVAFKFWDRLDRVLGPRPVNNPPEDHLFESGLQQTAANSSEQDAPSMISDSTSSFDGSSAELQEEPVQSGNPNKRDKRIVRGSRNKKPRLTDVLEKSNEEMGKLKELIASSITTQEEREKERKDDRVFWSNVYHAFPNNVWGNANDASKYHY